MDTLCEEYLKRHDPILKAQRALNRKTQTHSARAQCEQKQPKSSKAQLSKERPQAKTGLFLKPLQKPIPMRTKHQILLRDQGQCRFHHKGERCQSRQFLHIHHRIPVAQGGGNKLDNLVLIYSEHHSAIHDNLRDTHISPTFPSMP